MKQSEIGITSQVRVIHGVARLFINGRITEGDSYVTYYTDNNRYREFSDIGFRIFSIPVYFSGRTINEGTQVPPFSKGVFDSDEGLTIVDREMKKLLDINPAAYVFFRVDTSLPKSWDEKHPEELNDSGLAGFPPRPNMASEIYKRAVKRHLAKFVSHVQDSDYADRVFGYQIAGGMTQEWLSFDYNASEGKRMREKYFLRTGKSPVPDDPDYLRFRNETNASFVCSLAKYVKTLTENRLVVGSFYGYTSAVPYPKFGHLGLKKILNCRDIDFLCAPIAYYTDRSVTEDNPLMVPLASLTLHGKLYFSENDTRTDLTRPGNDLPAYQSPIWWGPERQTSLQMCLMHFASGLCHGHTYWWFDMWGGWYDDPDYLSLFRKLREISVSALAASQESVAEVAVIESTDSMCHVTDNGKLDKTNRDIFPLLGKTGIPYDVYLSSDFGRIKDRYKYFIVLCPYLSEDLRDIVSLLRIEEKKHLIYDESACFTSSSLRSAMKEAGVSSRFDHDVIVYENASYFYIHGTENCVLAPPAGMKLEPLLGNYGFPLRVEKGKGYLFRKVITPKGV